VKRIILVMLSALLVSAIIFGGCGEPAETTTPTEPTETTEPEAKSVTWRYTCFIPPADKVAQITIDWGNKIEEATDGRMKINFYWAESLVKMVGEFDAIASGTADAGAPSFSQHPERFPLDRFRNIPWIYSSIPQVAKVRLALLDKYEECRQELLPTRELWYNAVPGDCLIVTKDRQINTMDDLKGLKLQVFGAETVKAFQLLGAVPVSIGTADRYSALETGVIDGSIEEWNFTWIWKLNEVTKYRAYLSEWDRARGYDTVVNIDSYNRLPEDLRQIFDELTDRDEMSLYIAESMVDFNAASKQKVIEYDEKVGNPPFNTIPTDELERWKEVTEPVVGEFIQELNDKGLPGQQFVDDCMAFAEQYK
jgi:TRAP-type C4-dicarboxylate transport system substrate-binding protein